MRDTHSRGGTWNAALEGAHDLGILVGKGCPAYSAFPHQYAKVMGRPSSAAFRVHNGPQDSLA